MITYMKWAKYHRTLVEFCLAPKYTDFVSVLFAVCVLFQVLTAFNLNKNCIGQYFVSGLITFSGFNAVFAAGLH